MTPVIFRKFENEITACFPTIPGSPGCATCYAHIGQHGSYSRAWYSTTKGAKPSEYAALLEELKSIGYDDLKIFKREQPWMRVTLELTQNVEQD